MRYCHTMHRLRLALGLLVLVEAATGAACASNDSGAVSDDPSMTSLDGGELDADPNAASQDDVTGPDVPPFSFPNRPPAAFGYALEDAFPGTFLSGAMEIQWPSGSTQPFVLERGGDIVRLHGDGTTDRVLDFESIVALRAEAGALGMALHPKFSSPDDPHPYVYVWFTKEGAPTHQQLARFTWVGEAFDAASMLVLVDQIEAEPEHNGARIHFGPDGFLYFANGDDLRSGVTAQRLDYGLFAGVFRIDVDRVGGAVSPAPPRQP